MTSSTLPADISDPGLTAKGVDRIEWAAREMPVLALIRERFAREKPLRGIRMAACLHVTTENGEPRARPAGRGGGPADLREQPALDAGRRRRGARERVRRLRVRASRGGQRDLLPPHPPGTRARPAGDDGRRRRPRRDDPPGNGASCWTASWAERKRRRRASSASARWRRPARLATRSWRSTSPDTKHLFDNRYGTGQSTIDGIIRATNVLLAGKVFVVAGYGWCGRGLASRARGLGAHVIVTEVDPVRALEAVMDGFQVMPMSEAARTGDFFVTVTGDCNVIDRSKPGDDEERRDHGQQRPLRQRDQPRRAARHERAHAPHPRLRGRVLATGRAQALPPRRGTAREPGGRGRAPGLGNGHVLREPGARHRVDGHQHAKLEKQVYEIPHEIDEEIARLSSTR